MHSLVVSDLLKFSARALALVMYKGELSAIIARLLSIFCECDGGSIEGLKCIFVYLFIDLTSISCSKVGS